MEPQQLTVADIASIKSLIEAACGRGTFRASELSTVGALYDKLDAFLNQAAAAATQGDQNA
jgi:hypothetical protein